MRLTAPPMTSATGPNWTCKADDVLDSRSSDAISERLRAFRQGLKKSGYVEGENVAIVYRFAENQYGRLPELAADLVRRQIGVIATAGDDVALVAKAATTTIPIIFLASQDPVNLGLVASLARPGSNRSRHQFFSGRSWSQSGWKFCVNWCPQSLVWPCWSIRPPLRMPSPR